MLSIGYARLYKTDKIQRRSRGKIVCVRPLKKKRHDKKFRFRRKGQTICCTGKLKLNKSKLSLIYISIEYSSIVKINHGCKFDWRD